MSEKSCHPKVDCRTWFGVYGSPNSNNMRGAVSGNGCLFLIEFRLTFCVCCFWQDEIQFFTLGIFRPIYNGNYFVILAVRLHVI